MYTWKKQAYALALLDDEFLATLLEQQEREIYARVASLDINEFPIEYIEGKVTQGNINIDGSSAVRRTCSLTMVAEDVNFHDYYWGLCTKFKLEIGVANKLTGEYSPEQGMYPDIVWFPEGIFIISAFNTSLSVNSYTISITGKDKMCTLNGEFGGQLFASIDFGQEEYKNKIFKKVDTSGITTSEGLMERQYYYQVNFDSNNWATAPDILDTDENYAFSQVGEKVFFTQGQESDKIGKYYKQENVYKPIMDINRYYSVIYQPYKLVNTPRDIFQNASSSGNFVWKANTYYCAKTYNSQTESDYFTLDNAKTSQNITYYKLIDIYELDYEYTIKKIPLEKIIRESVHNYAKEPYSNIIINDLDDYGLEQLTYKGDVPLIAIRDCDTGNFVNLTFASNFQGKTVNNTMQGTGGSDFYFDIEDDEIKNVYKKQSGTNTFRVYSDFRFDNLADQIVSNEATTIYFNPSKDQNVQHQYQLAPTADPSYRTYTFADIHFGDDIGYRVTDLTYTGDLVSGIGDSLTSILDKIKTMLGDFEYFYNLDGQFVFQRKKTYVNTAWSQLTKTDDETYVTYANDKKKFSFNFEGNRLISAVQNSPVLSNLKNDFVVWGKRKSLTGQDIPIHARYAIDKKPTEYMSFKGIFYYTEDAKLYPSDQYNEILNSDFVNYRKKSERIPKCLIDADPYLKAIKNDDEHQEERRNNTLWYELEDWAQYYSYITGANPTQPILNYIQGNGFEGTIKFGDSTINFSANNQNEQHRRQILIDFQRKDSYANDTIVYDEFTPYYPNPFHTQADCENTTYDAFLSRYDEYPSLISYIYNPIIPKSEVIALDNGSLGWKRVKCVDWRELIYQMALDYFAGQGCSEKTPIYDLDGNLVIDNPDHFLSAIAERNRDTYPTGYTGYEQYYTDMEGFWRQLYNPDYLPQVVYDIGHYKTGAERMGNSSFYIKTKTWESKSITDMMFEYYVPIDSEAYQKYIEIDEDPNLSTDAKDVIDSKISYIVPRDSGYSWWNINVFNNPESINFWIEFLDEGEELNQFSVPSLGDRTKVVNDDKVSAIIFKEIPDIILYDRFAKDDDGNDLAIPDTSDLRKKIEENTGYTWVYLPRGFSKYLTMSYRSVSAKNKIDELLYQYAYCIENVSITALPVYHLEPNTRIYVCDKTTGVIGEYIVNKITLPLTYNGTMSITATLAPERLY